MVYTFLSDSFSLLYSIKFHFILHLNSILYSLAFRQNAFEVVGMDGTSSGVIHSDDTQSLHDWIQCISHNITLLNNQSVSFNLFIKENVKSFIESECSFDKHF